MKSLYRLCWFSGVFYLVVAALVAAGYFLYFRPMWTTPEILERRPRDIDSPTVTVEGMRQIALASRELMISAFSGIDAAISLLVIVSIGAALILLYVGARLRAAARRQRTDEV